MDKDYLILKARRRAAGPGIARWTLAFGHHEDRTPTHGYAATREGRHGRVRQELAAGVEGSLAVGKSRTSSLAENAANAKLHRA